MDLNPHVGDSVSELVGEIRGLAKKTVEPSRVESVVNEVRAHLEASLRARLEMGVEAETAERETVASFGDAEAFITKMAVQHPMRRNGWMDRPSLIAMLAGLCFAAFFLALDRAYGSFPLALGVLYVFGLIGLSIWIIVTSWRARLLPVIPLFLTFLIGIPLVSAFNAVAWMPRALYRVQAEKEVIEASANFTAALKARDDFNASANDNFFNPDANHRPTKIIWKRSRDNSPDTFQLIQATSTQEAIHSWQKVLPLGYRVLDAEIQNAGQRMAFETNELNKSYFQHVVTGISDAITDSASFSLFIFYLSTLSWLMHYFGGSIKRRFGPKGIAR